MIKVLTAIFALLLLASAAEAIECNANFPVINGDYPAKNLLVFLHPGKVDAPVGLLSDQEPGVNGGMFVAPLAYPAYHAKSEGLPSGLSLVAIRTSPSHYTLHVQGAVSSGEKNTAIKVVAYNAFVDAYGPCPGGIITLQLFFQPTVTMIPAQMPWIVLNKELFPSNYAIFIAANDGTISAISIAPINTTSPHPLSYYGISDDPTPLLGKLSGDLRLTGTVTQPTFVEQAYQVSVTNSEGEIAKATFDLVIQGAPVVADANLGSGSYARGQIITPVSLSSHFKNPLQSGSINYVLSDSTGDQGSAVTAKYGVLVQNGQLVGKVPAAAPSGTVQIYVQGQNMIGVSGKAYYSLTVG